MCANQCVQVHPGVPAGLRRVQPPVAVPVRRRLRQAPAGLEPLRAVHHRGGEQGPEKVQVLG